MSEIFGVHFAAHDESGGLHQFAPGDDVPEWLDGRVGDHCLILAPVDDFTGDDDPDGTPPPSSDDDDPDDDAGDDGDNQEAPADDAPAGDAPDFTKPATRRAKK